MNTPEKEEKKCICKSIIQRLLSGTPPPVNPPSNEETPPPVSPPSNEETPPPVNPPSNEETPPPNNQPDNESILQKYKQKIKGKRNVVYTLIIIMAILFLTDIVVYIVFNSTIPTNGKIMLWLFLLILSIALYYLVRKSHRFQNALYRLDILLLRIQLDKSNDLVKPYRIDREIEMIYRILEA